MKRTSICPLLLSFAWPLIGCTGEPPDGNADDGESVSTDSSGSTGNPLETTSTGPVTSGESDGTDSDSDASSSGNADSSSSGGEDPPEPPREPGVLPDPPENCAVDFLEFPIAQDFSFFEPEAFSIGTGAEVAVLGTRFDVQDFANIITSSEVLYGTFQDGPIWSRTVHDEDQTAFLTSIAVLPSSDVALSFSTLFTSEVQALRGSDGELLLREAPAYLREVAALPRATSFAGIAEGLSAEGDSDGAVVRIAMDGSWEGEGFPFGGEDEDAGMFLRLDTDGRGIAVAASRTSGFGSEVGWWSNDVDFALGGSPLTLPSTFHPGPDFLRDAAFDPVTRVLYVFAETSYTSESYFVAAYDEDHQLLWQEASPWSQQRGVGVDDAGRPWAAGRDETTDSLKVWALSNDGFSTVYEQGDGSGVLADGFGFPQYLEVGPSGNIFVMSLQPPPDPSQFAETLQVARIDCD
ncbi:MAG: hypothetical protein AAF799_10255 [Myxococcota bacterium]